MRDNEKMRRRLHGFLCGLVGAAVVMAVVLLGFGGFRGFGQAAKFASVMRLLRTQYVGDADLDYATDMAISGAIASLDDAWSYYMDAEGYDAYEDYSANVYQGIGVTIQADEPTGGFLIVTTDRDGPADRAGITAGEVILAVDGISVVGGTTEDLRALIQADFGKDAVVTVRSADGTQRDVTVSCEQIYQNPVRYQMLDGKVGYVSIANFHTGSAQEAIDAVDALMEEGAEGLVFDLRDDPGGQVSELVAILDHLLPEGDLFIRADKKGREVVEKSDAACVDIPMAAVVNSQSYSAAEFFAAALRDYGCAGIAGEHTTGKARSQVTYKLWDGSAVHLSKYTYLTPSRTDLYEAGGLAPDAEVYLSDEDQMRYLTGWLEPAEDAQVQAAVGLLSLDSE